MRLAIKIGHEGEINIVEFGKKENTLKYLQEAVGGYIECVTVRIDDVIADMWVNEEGLLERLPINKLATQIHELKVGNENACIVGNVILTGYNDEDGNTLPLSLEEATTVLHWLLLAADRNFESPHFILEA